MAKAAVAVFDQFRQTYGCRRIAHVPNTERGISCSVGLVAEIMRENALVAVQPRAYKLTTVADEQLTSYPTDAIGRDFTAQAPGPGWSGTSPTCVPGKAGCTWPP